MDPFDRPPGSATERLQEGGRFGPGAAENLVERFFLIGFEILKTFAGSGSAEDLVQAVTDRDRVDNLW